MEKKPAEPQEPPKMPTRRLPHPWPFRESIVPGRGLVRNLPPEKKPKKD
jgi:hypothetical protein